jgi:hypothetical protein
VVEQRKNSVHDTKLNEINRKLNVFLKHLQMKRSDYMATLPFTLYSLLLKRSDITLYSWSRCDPFQWNKIINLKNGILNQIGLRVTEGHMKTAVVRLAIMGINPGIKFLIRATH